MDLMHECDEIAKRDAFIEFDVDGYTPAWWLYLQVDRKTYTEGGCGPIIWCPYCGENLAPVIKEK